MQLLGCPERGTIRTFCDTRLAVLKVHPTYDAYLPWFQTFQK